MHIEYGSRFGAMVVALAVLLSAGCATPTQVVPLYVDPPTAAIYVDGAQLPGAPTELALASDRSHILFFRGEGYRPQQLVLVTSEKDGVHSLEPAEIRVRLAPLVPVQREVVIEATD